VEIRKRPTDDPCWLLARAIVRGGHELVIGDPIPMHVDELAFTMRPADKLEIERHSGSKPRAALTRAIAVSTVSRVALINGSVAAIWGVAIWHSAFSGTGSPWCFTSNVIDQHKRLFMNCSRFYLEELRGLCPRNMEVRVDATYGAACRWLLWLGFTLDSIDHNGHAFYVASIREDRQCASR
jgi:hypothetical protein